MLKKFYKRMLQRKAFNKKTQQAKIDVPIPGTLKFRCNICSHINFVPMAALQREQPSCMKCCSTVRMRGIVHALSVALFGKSLSIQNFPEHRKIVGKGMSDWDGYAKPLARQLSYVNTYYHKEPHLDITRVARKDHESVDFLVSSDVFEHVAPPVSIAFENARKMLRGNGALIFSVPYSLEKETVEHFPNLHRYHIEKSGGNRILVNQTKEGIIQKFEDLVFHGGEGETLEVRIFSENSLMSELRTAGFNSVSIMRDPCFEHGVYWPQPWSLPIIARCFAPETTVLDWGPRTSRLGHEPNAQGDGRSGLWLIIDSDLICSNLALSIGELSTDNLVINEHVITAIIPKSILKTPGGHTVTLIIDNLIQVYVGEFLVYS